MANARDGDVDDESRALLLSRAASGASAGRGVRHQRHGVDDGAIASASALMGVETYGDEGGDDEAHARALNGEGMLCGASGEWWRAAGGRSTRRIAALTLAVMGVASAVVAASTSSAAHHGGGLRAALSAAMAPRHRANARRGPAAKAQQPTVIREEFYKNPSGRVDQLAVAAALDPAYHRYLPDAYHGFDPVAPYDTYAHPPAVSKSKSGFTMCVDTPPAAWDTAYVKGFGRLFEPGVCVDKIVIGCDNSTRADVRIFSQSAYLWRGKNKAKDLSYNKPKKVSPEQVDMYLAHEAVGTFGQDLHRENVVGAFDYLGYFDQKKSAFWWPFGPSLNSLTGDFPAYTTPHKDRIPGIAWLAIDCLPPRSRILSYISQAFPVFSFGSCMHNAQVPAGLPGRGIENLKYQSMMARYMFYFALENAPLCEGYMTEKIWLALSRGSIPIYIGSDSIDEMLPVKNSYVDLRKYDTIEALAAELREIATNETRYDEYTSWRYAHPSAWSDGFRRLLRVMSSDIKLGICSILQKGESEYMKAAPLGGCEHDWNVFGMPHAKIPTVGKPTNPLDHLDKLCDEPTQACYEFKYPEYKFIPVPAVAARINAAATQH